MVWIRIFVKYACFLYKSAQGTFALVCIKFATNYNEASE